MTHTWYVTFEVHDRGAMPKRRSPRATRTFETEKEAKDFAQAKFNEGLIVHAGTIIPYKPGRTIASSDIPAWLDDELEQQGQDDAQASERKKPG
jgi:hypothetical protein